MKTLLVPTDFNELSAAALRFGSRIARADDARIVAVYADTFASPVELATRETDESMADSRAAVEVELRVWAARQLPNDRRVLADVREGMPVAGIVAAAEERAADLIVLGTHGRGGLARVFLGSVTEAVLRSTKRPVLTLRQLADDREIRKVVAGVRPDVPFLPIVNAAAALAEAAGAQLELVLISDAAGMADARARVESLLPPLARLRELVRRGDPVDQLLDCARIEKADVLAIGRERKLGVTRHAPCAVLSVVEA